MKPDFEAILKKYVDPSVKITAQSDLIDDLGLCSFDMMMIITEMEDLSGKKFDFHQVDHLHTVQDLMGQFENKR